MEAGEKKKGMIVGQGEDWSTSPGEKKKVRSGENGKLQGGNAISGPP